MAHISRRGVETLRICFEGRGATDRVPTRELTLRWLCSRCTTHIKYALTQRHTRSGLKTAGRHTAAVRGPSHPPVLHFLHPLKQHSAVRTTTLYCIRAPRALFQKLILYSLNFIFMNHSCFKYGDTRCRFLHFCTVRKLFRATTATRGRLMHCTWNAKNSDFNACMV